MSQKSTGPFHILVKLVAEPGYGQQLGELVRENASRFSTEPGFISNELFALPDGQTYASLIRWRSEADHLACLNSERQRDCQVGELIQSGKVNMEIIPLSLVYPAARATGLRQPA